MPRKCCWVWLYGYASDIFSSRPSERATYEMLAFCYIAGNMHSNHDTLNAFRKENLAELKGLFVEVLLMAHFMGYVKLGNLSIDGSKLHADASKSKAVSYGRIGQMETGLQAEFENGQALARSPASSSGVTPISDRPKRSRLKMKVTRSIPAICAAVPVVTL